jgi:hypothetical protein
MSSKSISTVPDDCSNYFFVVTSKALKESDKIVLKHFLCDTVKTSELPEVT